MGWSQVAPDSEAARIIAEEEQVCARVARRLAGRRVGPGGTPVNYDAQLVELRDQLAETSQEDLAPLVEHMTRLAGVAANRPTDDAAHLVDRSSPYFAHLVLEQQGRRRDLLIGRRGFSDREAGVTIVDWRNAPVSRLYYSCEEGDEFEEEFGGREVEGRVLVRRGLTLQAGRLRRILAPQGTFVRDERQGWLGRDSGEEERLQGGSGMAVRAPRPPRLADRAALAHGGRNRSFMLGAAGAGIAYRPDRHLPEITALIDPEQFGRISLPDAGVVVIQGGAGSGKTTVALHRVAYLHYQEPQRFRPSRCLVVVLNESLVRYVERVLPSLGVQGVPVLTGRDWARRLRQRLLPRLRLPLLDTLPEPVARLKQHPVMLTLLERHVRRRVDEVGAALERRLAPHEPALPQPVAPAAPPALAPPGDGTALVSDRAAAVPDATLAAATDQLAPQSWEDFAATLLAEGEAAAAGETATARQARQLGEDRADVARVVQRWAQLDGQPLIPRLAALGEWLERARLGGRTLLRARTVVGELQERSRDLWADWAELLTDRRLLERELAELAPGVFSPALLDEAVRWCGDQLDWSSPEEEEDRRRPRDADGEPVLGIDGQELEEGMPSAGLDPADDPLLLRLHQLTQGRLQSGRGQETTYAHVVVDEAQDLGAVELKVLLEATPQRSLTLAGDMAQKLVLTNGVENWSGLLDSLGVPALTLEPLRIAYRSTAQITLVARAVLGALADPLAPDCPRQGAPVELFTFAEEGALVAFLGEALRSLIGREPQATVAVIAREPAGATALYEALDRTPISRLRRVAHHDFSFEPGIDVTDIAQVKGLEFDYVVLPDVSASTYPDLPANRHMLHIGATRAAHQLWLLCSGEPSPLLPVCPSGELAEVFFTHEV